MKRNGQQLLFPNDTTPSRPAPGFRESLTFKANRNLGRHGWLRLTPAYSRHLVERLIAPLATSDRVLDPFCGTGTTAMTCAEKGIPCDTVDVNPFLVWLANAKFARYQTAELQAATAFASNLRLANDGGTPWYPPIRDIEKWWAPSDLHTLATLFAAIQQAELSEPTRNLVLSAFCRVAIETAAVSFGHQSMSFQERTEQQSLTQWSAPEHLKHLFTKRLAEIVTAAATPIAIGLAKAFLGDSRTLDTVLEAKYSCVITSPPYPNRMSYIRELRPYMFWLGFLHDGRQAGELDWKAIGGTWGCATSNLMRWRPDGSINISFDGFNSMIKRISARSFVLSLYVHKYFEDCVLHFRSLSRILRKGAIAHYIVGNSRFYDVMVPTEEIYRDIMSSHGFRNVHVENIRKRTSKKELFEFVVRGVFTPE